MRKRYKMGLIIISVLLVIAIAFGVLKIFFPKEKEEKEPVNVSSVISNISDYGYTLDDRDTKYMKEVFDELRAILESSEVDYEAYAKALSKLFIIDFYTLDNKINKYDVGGSEYILSSIVDMFKLKAADTIYRDIIDNTYRDRVQDLPEVTNVEVINVENTTYTLDEEVMDAIKVEVTIEYKEDLGYDTEGTLYLVKNAKKLEIVSFTPSIEEV